MHLTYQPAFDAFHTVFRMMRIREDILPPSQLTKDHARIIDFYLLFPFRISGIRLLPRHKKYRKLSEKYQSLKPYGNMPDDRVIFRRMTPIQLSSLDTMAVKGYIDQSRYEHGILKTSEIPLNEALKSRIDAINTTQSDLIEFLAALATEYHLLGADGLKARTGLMEHAYDAT